MKHPATYISKQLLVCITLAYITGITISPRIRLTDTGVRYVLATLILLVLILAGLHFLRKSQTFLCLLILFFITVGCFHGYLKHQFPRGENHIYNLISSKTEVVLIGTMATMASFNGRTSQATIEAENIRYREKPGLIPATGQISLSLQGPWPDELSPGDKLAIRADLKRPNSFRTPGAFDYAQYLARKNIWISGFVRSPLFLHKVQEEQNLFHRLRYLAERLRTKIGKQIDKAVPTKTSGVYRAVLIGDRRQLDEKTLETFKGSGTMHILAISGLHMSVIGILLYTSFYWILSRSEKLLLHFTIRKWAAFLSLPVLVGYGLLAGMNTPVFRALIMSSIVIIAVCTDRQKSPGALLAFAAMLILMVEPLQLFTVSFQLSFTAIIGILFLLPVLKNIFYRSHTTGSKHTLKQTVSNWILAGLLVSLVATLVTAPLVLYSFNRFSIVSPFANLFIEPLICFWSLPAGFISIPFIFIEPTVSSFLLQAGAHGLHGAMTIAALFSSFSFSTIWLPTPPLLLITIYFTILIVFALWGWKTGKRSLLCSLFLSITIILFIHFSTLFQGRSRNSFRVTYLDVGQGSSTLLEYPSGYRVLIDGGGSSLGTTTVGERIIAPYLWKKGIKKIDAIALTHPDADHYNGLNFIIQHFSPSILWVRDKEQHDINFRQLLQLCEKRHVTIVIPEEGKRLGQGVEYLECIANTSIRQKNIEFPDSQNSSNSGIVLKACYRDICSLFPGDIERADEITLANGAYNLQTNLMLASHHGSATSNSPEFLSAVSPQYLIVSAGRSSKGYFPNKSVVKEALKQQITLFSTARRGTLEVVAEKDSYRIYEYAREHNNPLYSPKKVLLGEKEIY